MAKSNFPFVSNTVLRANLDEAFDHVVTLLPFTESATYNTAAKSAFRKTIIIYTASIVEALLFHVLDSGFSEDDVAEYYSHWELKGKQELYKVSEDCNIVGGSYKKVAGDGRKEKLNLAQIDAFLKDKKVITARLFEKVEELKKLRNEQHISTQTKVKSYTKTDLEKAFSVAGDVKAFAHRKLTA